MTSRGAQVLDHLRVELAHAQQRDRIRDAHRRLDQLLDQQARLDSMDPWSRPEGRAGQLVVAIRECRERIAELEASREVERIFNLPPILDVSQPPTGKPGLPPSWLL